MQFKELRIRVGLRLIQYTNSIGMSFTWTFLSMDLIPWGYNNFIAIPSNSFARTSCIFCKNFAYFFYSKLVWTQKSWQEKSFWLNIKLSTPLTASARRWVMCTSHATWLVKAFKCKDKKLSKIFSMSFTLKSCSWNPTNCFSSFTNNWKVLEFLKKLSESFSWIVGYTGYFNVFQLLIPQM